jgi:putative inorganic carbon (hco3(-)) transporter
VAAELARLGGVIGGLGLAALLVAPGRVPRLAGLTAWVVGAVLLALDLAPRGHETKLAAAAGGGLALAAVGAAVLLRWPWLLLFAGLACVPARIPVTIGAEKANLLLPLYGVVAAAAVALAVALVRGDGRTRELGLLAWPLAAFSAWSGVSVLWTDDVREGSIALLAFVLPFGVLAISIARLEWSRRLLSALYVQLVLMALVFAAIGLYQWLTRDVFWNPKVIVGNAYAPFYRVNSVFWDPSIYGRFLVIAILASLVLVLYGGRGRLLLAAGAAIAATWAGLVVSFSQSSFAALIVGVLAAAALAWRWRAAAALGIASVALLSVGFSAPPVRDAIFENVEAGLNKATSGRADLVTSGARIALDHPVTGVGVGGFRRAYAEETGLRGEEPKRAASHNTPVTVAAETGFPGLVLLLWLVAAAVLVPLRRASRSFAGRTSLIVASVLLAIAVHSLFYNAFFEDPTTWALFGLAALVAGWRTSAEEADA